MNDFKMGFRHTMLQRMQNYSVAPAKLPSSSPIPSIPTHEMQTPTTQNVTDFSINRILGDKSEKSIGKSIKSAPISVVKPTPYNANPVGILDLSKNSTTPSETIAPFSQCYNLNYANFFQPEFLAATKFYAHFFPHMFPAAYAATTSQLAAAPIGNFQKRFFAPYVLNSSGTGKASMVRQKPVTSVAEHAHHSKQNTCTRSDCPDCLNFYRYPVYKSTTSPTVKDAYTHAAQISNAKSLSSIVLNSAASISLTTTTNLNITSSKSINLEDSLDTHNINGSSSCIPEEITYKCRICDKVFGCSQTLQAHEKTHKSPRYECTDCGKGFSQLRNYKYHLSVHRGTKEFAAECPECGKTFNDKGYLSSHMKIHRNKKEYECPYCPKSFNQRVAFNMHVRIHTGVKPHKCVECGKRFSRKMLLKQHMRTHSGEKPYQCSVCGKSFADRSNMTLHHRLHSGIKPFNCPICPKAFTKKHHLKTHLNYHTGCKPYVCPHQNCNQAFTQSSNMRTHAKKCQYRPLQMSTLPLNSSVQQPTGLSKQTSNSSNLLASHFVQVSGHVGNATQRQNTIMSPLTSTFTAGIQMLSANAGNSSASATATSSASSTTSHSIRKPTMSFPPTQQPLLTTTLRPF